MIKLLRSKKLKRVKRVPKLKKFKFEDEQKTLNSKSNYMKFVYIIILAISFSVGNFFVINPTIQKDKLKNLLWLKKSEVRDENIQVKVIPNIPLIPIEEFLIFNNLPTKNP